MHSQENTPQYNPLQQQPVPEFMYPEQSRTSVADMLHQNNGAVHLAGNSLTLSSDVGSLIAENSQPGVNVEQRLIGYIGAGDDAFSIIEAKSIGANSSHLLLAKIDPHGKNRPSIYGVLDKGATIEIGRDYDQGLSERTSREHLSVTNTGNGVTVLDLHSKNGTQVLSVEKLLTQEQTRPSAFSAKDVARGIFRKKVVERNESTNELSNINLWSVKSSEVRQTIDEIEKPTISNLRYGLMEKDQEYAENTFKNLTENQDAVTAAKIRSIIFSGQLGGQGIDAIEHAQRNAHEVLNGRINFAKIFNQNPHEAELLADDQVAGFHGTRSTALAGILKQGYIGSGKHLREQEAFVLSGEHIFQDPAGQKGISFSSISALGEGALSYAGASHSITYTVDDMHEKLRNAQEMSKAGQSNEQGSNKRWLEVKQAIIEEQSRALKYIIDNPNSLEAQLSLNDFPVVITMSRDGIERTEKDEENWSDGRINNGGVVRGTGEYSEFRLMADRVQKEEVPLILVPEKEVEHVRELCKEYGFANTRVSDLETYINAVT